MDLSAQQVVRLAIKLPSEDDQVSSSPLPCKADLLQLAVDGISPRMQTDLSNRMTCLKSPA